VSSGESRETEKSLRQEYSYSIRCVPKKIYIARVMYMKRGKRVPGHDGVQTLF
jgi:hypothetical protein